MNGDDDQLEAWILQYSYRLLRVAYTYTRDWAAAEDRVQEAFIKSYRSMHQLKNKDNIFPWLVRIVINECKSFQRKRFREVFTTLFPERMDISSEDTYLRHASFKEIHQAILSLPEIYRTPIVLFYFEDMSIRQIASALQKNTETIKTRLSRGRERLRKRMERGVKNEHRRANSRCKTLL